MQKYKVKYIQIQIGRNTKATKLTQKRRGQQPGASQSFLMALKYLTTTSYKYKHQNVEIQAQIPHHLIQIQTTECRNIKDNLETPPYKYRRQQVEIQRQSLNSHPDHPNIRLPTPSPQSLPYFSAFSKQHLLFYVLESKIYGIRVGK